MSDAFAFMFAFYGLILGLAVTEIASGFSRAYDERQIRPVGVIAPLFGVLLLADLITFWMNAWAYRDQAEISYVSAYAVAIVALLYYFAATQVFPKATNKERLDDHILEHRRVVAFCVIASNVMTQIPPTILAITTPWPLQTFILWAGLNMIYYILLLVAGFAKSKIVVGAALVTGIVYVVSVSIAFS